MADPDDADGGANITPALSSEAMALPDEGTEHLLPIILKSARERAKITQIDLAARCDVAQSGVARWESGRSPVGEAILEAVAKALGTSVEDLLLKELSIRRRTALKLAKSDARGQRRKGRKG